MPPFTRRLRALQDLFPSSGREVVAPNEASDLLSFTHPFPGKISLIAERLDTDQFISAAAVTPFLSTPFVGADTYENIWAMTVFHNSATARRLILSILTQGGITVTISSLSTPAAPLPSQLPVFGSASDTPAPGMSFNAERPLILFPGQALLLSGDTAGVAYTVELRRVLARVPLPTEPLFG